jgi:hypothetical protein
MNQQFLIRTVQPTSDYDKNYINFYDPLKASYESHDEAENRMKKYGYNYDRDLSNDETKVFYNPDQSDNKKLLVTFRGSKVSDDWINTNPSILFGGFTNTRRYKDSENTLNQAKQKYNSNGALLVGHSMGGSLSSSLGKENDTIYTFNKGAGSLFNHNTHNKLNENAYRWNNDIVSSGSFLNTRKSHTIGYKKSYKKSHDLKNLKEHGIMI